MDFTRFINSKDIRKHLQNIYYEPDSLKSAWLVYQCQNATLKEKHGAWQYLIENMPDMRIEGNERRHPQDSLHKFLHDYMTMERKWLEEFAKCENYAVYRISGWMIGASEWMDFCDVSSSYVKCLDRILRSAKDGDYSLFKIEKSYIDSIKPSFCMTLSTAGEPMSIIPETISDEFDRSLRNDFFDLLWFDFPTPFKPGDIVHDPFGFPAIFSGPFVLKQLHWEEHIEYGARIETVLNLTDMDYTGYFQNTDSGQIHCDDMWNYMDLEYYRQPLKGKQRILKAFSNFLKGRIDVSLLCEAYRHIMNEEDAKPISFYTKYEQSLAGIDE